MRFNVLTQMTARNLLAGKYADGQGLWLLILTSARTSEVRLAPFTEFEGDIWSLAGERTKTGAARRIPLGAEAMTVVQLCRTESCNGYLFSAYKGQPISDMAMSKLMKDNGYKARPRGFRATFRTWVEEQTDTPFEVKEACLGHVVDSETVGAYQRSD